MADVATTDAVTNGARRVTDRPAVVSYAVRMTFGGQVHGVGFRSFVYRLAVDHGVTGYVQNVGDAVEIVACGKPAVVQEFRRDLTRRPPPLAKPRITGQVSLDTVPFEEFSIVRGTGQADQHRCLPPDFFACDDCLREVSDPASRYYRYPFTNCNQCGPRYTIIDALPYSRENTAMAGFDMSPECAAEYRDPDNRRYHAEATACPTGGPQLRMDSTQAGGTRYGDDALRSAVDHLKSGSIVAIKGVGGYQLVCDARNETAVARLRRRKRRPEQPFAVMFPAAGGDGTAVIRRYAELEDGEQKVIGGPERPVVLVAAKPGSDLAPSVVPDAGEFGVVLPYSPLHHLLIEDFGGPLLVSSGTISGEPVVTDNDEATRRLGKIADAFLHHDRPILRPSVDPI